MNRGFLKKVLIIFLSVQIIMMSSCFYETKTGIKKVPIYSEKQITKGTEEAYLVTPIIEGDNLTIAFISITGGNLPDQQHVTKAIELSFSNGEGRYSDNKSITHISTDKILNKISAVDLERMDKEVEMKLNQEFGINVICSSEIIKDEADDKQLSIKVKNCKTNQTINLIFEGESWELLSNKVAEVFTDRKIQSGENSKIPSVKDEILGYKIESYKYKDLNENVTYPIWGVIIIAAIALLVSSTKDSGEGYEPDDGGGHIKP